MLVSTFLMNTVVRLLVIGYGAHLYFGSAMDFEKLSRFVFFVDMLQSWTNMLFDSFSNLVKSGSCKRYTEFSGVPKTSLGQVYIKWG